MSALGRAAWAAVTEMEACQQTYGYCKFRQRTIDDLRRELEAAEASRKAEAEALLERTARYA